MTASSRKNWTVFLIVAGSVISAAALYWQLAGFDDDTISAAIRHSGRVAFAIFLLVLVARPLHQVVKANWTAALRRNRRYVGIAFAAIMAMHLIMIVLRVNNRPELEFPTPTLIVGGIGYGLVALMFITSFDGPTRALGPRAWKWLHRLGLVWISYIFAIPRSVEDLADPDYLKFGIPFAVALAIRITAWQQSRRPGN